MEYCAPNMLHYFFQRVKGTILTRREAREYVFALLFETEFRTDETVQEIFATSVENREIPEDEFIRVAYFTIAENRERIDGVIGDHAHGWKTSRLTRVSRSILRLCVYEMLYMPDVPYTVSINEAIEIAKKYDEEKARPFINGVLNSVKTALENGALTTNEA